MFKNITSHYNTLFLCTIFILCSLKLQSQFYIQCVIQLSNLQYVYLASVNVAAHDKEKQLVTSNQDEIVDVDISSSAQFKTKTTSIFSTVYIESGTEIVDLNSNLHGKVVFFNPIYETPNEQKLNEIVQKNQSHLSKEEKEELYKKHNQSIELNTLPRPLQHYYIFYRHNHFATLFKNIAFQVSKTFTNLKQNMIFVTYYKYSNTSLFNKKIALQPVNRYLYFLESNFLSLPPPLLCRINNSSSIDS